MNIIEFLARELNENIVCRIDVGANEAITITDKNEVYSGCYGNVAVSFYAYEFTGKYGVGVGLNGIQKTADGERLDGGTSVDDFDIIDENDDLFN